MSRTAHIHRVTGETDVSLELDLDGGEVASLLRKTPGCENAVIIALTGLGDEQRPRMLQSGCDAFYTKPLEIDLIEGLLKR